jgi:hypothetical protein
LSLSWRRSALCNRDHSNPKHNRKQNLFHQYGSLDLWEIAFSGNVFFST